MSTQFDKDFTVVDRLMTRLVGEHSRRHVSLDEVVRHDLSPQGTLWKSCAANEVLPHVGHVLRDLGVNLPSAWQAAHDQSEQRITSLMRELDAAAELLGNVGIPVVALKNAGIARGLHSCWGCCPMGDLDVLVERRHFRKAHTTLVAAGYNFEFRSPLETAELDEAEASGGAEYWKTLDNGERLWFELQWRPIAGRWLRPHQEPKAADLIARSESVNTTDRPTEIRLLAPEDNLLQVAVHTAKHSYVRAPGFRLHTDVDRIVKCQPINWSRFIDAVKSRQLCTAVYFSLRIPYELFDTPIPTEVMEELRPPAWKTAVLAAAIRRAGLLDPKRPKFNKLAYIRFNALLYDNPASLARGIFPEPAWMSHRYEVRGPISLANAYFRRIWDLTFHRTGI